MTEIDLHLFRPQDMSDVIREYFSQCQQEGVLEVRIVHGRGRFQLAVGVHALLDQLPEVMAYSIAAPAYGGSGATWVRLRPGSPAIPGFDSLKSPPGESTHQTKATSDHK